MNEKRKLRAKQKIKPKKDDISNTRTFFSLDTTKKTLKIFEIRELIKPKIKNFLLTSTLRKRTVI